MCRFFAALCVVLCPLPAWAKTFSCSAGDVACLITSINEANANGKKNTINLKAGTYTLTVADNGDLGNETGLPQITSTLTINGKGPDVTILERSEPGMPFFRLLYVAETGNLTLEGLTIRHGRGVRGDGGGGLVNQGGVVAISDAIFTDNTYFFGDGGGLANYGGIVTVTDSVFSHNSVELCCGGLLNQDGTVTIERSTFATNGSAFGGGLGSWGGTVTITDSTFVGNGGAHDGGGLLATNGQIRIVNTTFARNGSADGAGGGLLLFFPDDGAASILNSTVVENKAVGSNGLAADMNTTLQNTLVAHNQWVGGFPEDCPGPITSLGNNLIGTLSGLISDCTTTLQPTDLTGDPGLGDFTENGEPGNGHVPLLSTSRAINAGNDSACPKKDQLGNKRKKSCDIGAIEFRP